MDLKCKQCGRWLGHTDTDMDGVTIKCGNCKTNNVFNVKIVAPKWARFAYNEGRRNDCAKSAEGQSKTADEPIKASEDKINGD